MDQASPGIHRKLACCPNALLRLVGVARPGQGDLIRQAAGRLSRPSSPFLGHGIGGDLFPVGLDHSGQVFLLFPGEAPIRAPRRQIPLPAVDLLLPFPHAVPGKITPQPTLCPRRVSACVGQGGEVGFRRAGDGLSDPLSNGPLPALRLHLRGRLLQDWAAPLCLIDLLVDFPHHIAAVLHRRPAHHRPSFLIIALGEIVQRHLPHPQH